MASFSNSARWIQWKWKAVDPPGQPGATRRSSPGSSSRSATSTEGGRRAAGGRCSTSPGLHQPGQSGPRRGAEGDQRQGDRPIWHEPPKDPKSKEPPKVLKTAGQQLDSFGQLRDDGSTSCGNWLYTGVYTEAGNNCRAPEHRRSARAGDVPPVGVQLAGQPPRHVQPRFRRRRRASPGIRSGPASSGTARSGWATSRTSSPTHRPGQFGAFIMLPEGVGRLFAPVLNDGPFPEHYEPVEAPVENALHPKVSGEPGGQAVHQRQGRVGQGVRLPDRLHHLPPHRALPLLDQAPGRWTAQRGPARHLLRDPRGAGEGEGDQERGQVRVSSARASIRARRW